MFAGRTCSTIMHQAIFLYKPVVSGLEMIRLYQTIYIGLLQPKMLFFFADTVFLGKMYILFLAFFKYTSFVSTSVCAVHFNCQ